MGFTKLDAGIVDSSIWSEPYPTRIVWVTFLAKADRNGMVRASRSGMARASNVTEGEFLDAERKLSSTDLDSRSKEHDGKRIEKVEGGWVVLNYRKYRDYSYSDSPDAIRQRRHREKGNSVTQRDMSRTPRDISASASVSNNKKRDKRGCIPSDQEKEVISLYNAITGQNRREAGDIISMIRARLAEGRTIDDFKSVITKKYNQWLDNEKMCKFIRPSTLFRPGNFEDYLNEPEPKVKGKEVGDDFKRMQDEATFGKGGRK